MAGSRALLQAMMARLQAWLGSRKAALAGLHSGPARQPWPDRAWLRFLTDELEAPVLAFLVSAAMISGYMTFIRLSEGFVPSAENTGLPTILLIDLGLIVVVALLLIRRFLRSLGGLAVARAGRRLLLRMVLFFSLVALVPTVTVTAVSILLVNFGLQSWFASPVSTAVKESRKIAEIYLSERENTVRNNATALAGRLAGSEELRTLDTDGLTRVMDQEAALRDIAEVLLVQIQQGLQDTTPIAKAGTDDFSQARQVEFTFDDLRRANQGELVPLPGSIQSRVSVLLKPDVSLPLYLLVTQEVDPDVLARVNLTKRAANVYEGLEASTEQTQRSALMIFAVIAAALVLTAGGMGLFFAASISAPISWLMQAAEQVGGGRLDVHIPVPNTSSKDEFSKLIQAFNRMISQLRSQRAALLGVNSQLDERRRFTEAVLAGVSAGVIGLDPEGRIRLANRRGTELLGIDLAGQVGTKLATLVPELAELLQRALASPAKIHAEELPLVNRNLEKLTLKAAVLAELRDQEVLGYIVTFDDVTELVAAQRSAAWSDVARRVAHEIKNPLTPIQLSAERLKRRYRKQLTEGLETFDLCTDTIVRQVDDIRQMVDEFSSFARSTNPKLERVEVLGLCKQALFLEGQAHRSIRYQLESVEETQHASLDARLFNQALLNILRNAADALVEHAEALPEDQRAGFAPKITLEVQRNLADQTMVLSVVDNGPGMPADKIDRLTDPYVTFKEKGTGLGLAIVKKIVQDHGGQLNLANRRAEDGSVAGAQVRLVFPLSPQAPSNTSDDTAVEPPQS